MRILAGGSCEMRESPAECVRVGNYDVLLSVFLFVFSESVQVPRKK